MNTDVHAAMRSVVDKSLVGSASTEEERLLRRHLAECAPCQEYMDAGHRVVAGLGGFFFDVEPALEARVAWSLKLRAQQLQAAGPSRQRALWGGAAALMLLVAGSLLAWQFGNMAAVLLHLQPALVQKAILWGWVLPSLCFVLLFPVLPLLSNQEERVL